MADIFDGVVIGAAAAAIGTIIAFKIINKPPVGGGAPNQFMAVSPTARGRVLAVPVPDYTDGGLAPLAQNTPTTEAAYNLQYIGYAPAFGTEENAADNEQVLSV